jgi:hypothetical protein
LLAVEGEPRLRVRVELYSDLSVAVLGYAHHLADVAGLVVLVNGYAVSDGERLWHGGSIPPRFAKITPLGDTEFTEKFGPIG